MSTDLITDIGSLSKLLYNIGFRTMIGRFDHEAM